MSGKLLYFFATNKFPVFGFDWDGACDISFNDAIENTTEVPILHISLPLLPCSLDNYTLFQTLEYITTLVSSVTVYWAGRMVFRMVSSESMLAT